jgi:hypothetical protein
MDKTEIYITNPTLQSNSPGKLLFCSIIRDEHIPLTADSLRLERIKWPKLLSYLWSAKCQVFNLEARIVFNESSL